MTVPNDSNRPYSAYDVVVELDGQPAAGFAGVSELRMELEPAKRDGPFAHATLVLQQGVTSEPAFRDWIHAAMRGTGQRRDIGVWLRDGERAWTFEKAAPITWSGPDLTTGQDGMTIDTLAVTYERSESML